MDKLRMQSLDAVDGNVAKIAALFPQCVTERKNKEGKVELAIDFDKLRIELSHEIVEGNEERYQFTWPDKRNAIRLANTPTTKTLRPCREESVDFDTTNNLYIEGDNLDVLKVLRENYLGKVKMIYIDPPYNTGNDFVYNDRFDQDKQKYIHNSGQHDEEGNQLVQNTESNGRFHTDWLNMIYPRLKVARDLLAEDGVIFISIDDNEQENLRKICDEIYGNQNFIGSFIVNSTPNARDYGHIGKMHEFVLFYAKDIFFTETNLLPVVDKTFVYRDANGGYNIHPLYNSNEAFHKGNRPNLYYPFYLYTNEIIKDGFYKIGFTEKEDSIKIFPPKSQKNGVQFVWRWGKDKAIANLNTEIIGYKTNQGESYKAGYKNICEIGKERIRRAGKKIKEESPLTTQDLDTGFRVLKLASSNMEDVYYTPSEFDEQKLFDDNIKPDRTDEDLLFQVMTELGIELSAKIEQQQIAGKTVWSVNNDYLIACFDKDVNETTITEIAHKHPYYFVMRDSSLATDNVADNFEQIWKHYSKATVRRIL